MQCSKWLTRALLITGAIVVVAFLITVNRGPLMEGFRPYQPQTEQRLPLCIGRDCETSPTFADWLGTILIILLILLIPIGHMAVIILVVQRLNHTGTVPTSSRLPACPYCGHNIHHGWKTCPACGNRLDQLK
ncbi:MAG: zinc ribbon domain-containing protein [Anaerolineae bacterium]|jgi:RNA polymerase subunit RPABC4/transcription elongation factor Spt4|nr:zinc ribbon domain-containing protein [Anaerolineae bacterium]